MSSPPASEDGPLVLIVDDDQRLREQLARAFARRGYVPMVAADHDQAVALASEHEPEMAVIDLRMPGPSGLELLRRLRQIDPETRVVMLTGYGSIATAIEAVKLGAVHYLQKPADADEILAAFEKDRGDTREGTVDADVQVPSLERVKWEHMSRVLEDCGGNVSEAARKLKLHRRSLQRMLQKLPPRQ
jgi:two-component system response regulator RegA